MTPNGKPRANTVAYEILHQLKHKTYDHEYPPEEKLTMYCSKYGNSNHELTIQVLKDVIDPAIASDPNEEGCVLWDDFKSHSKQKLLKAIIIIGFSLCMYFFFNSKL